MEPMVLLLSADGEQSQQIWTQRRLSVDDSFSVWFRGSGCCLPVRMLIEREYIYDVSVRYNKSCFIMERNPTPAFYIWTAQHLKWTSVS